MNLTEVLLEHAACGRERLARSPALDAIVDRAVETGRAAWPDVSLPAEIFVRHLAERLPVDGDMPAALERTHAGDLYLACACALGDAPAIAAFERTFVPQIALFLARRRSLLELTDEVQQALRERLLVSERGLLPRIGSYTGRGPLGAWLRTTAVRVALNLRESLGGPRAEADELPHLVAPGDPELSYLKAHYQPELKAALTAALAALSTRERNVVRLFLLDGVPAEAIGGLYHVTGRSVRRWVEGIREQILQATLRQLESRLELSRAELGSLLGLIRSRIDLSLTALLERQSRSSGVPREAGAPGPTTDRAAADCIGSDSRTRRKPPAR